jgi:hypothetical protein
MAKTTNRTTSATVLAEAVRLVRSEYLESPGLRLTRSQMRRLWTLDDELCDAVLQVLVDKEFLRRSSDGGYVRADIGA